MSRLNRGAAPWAIVLAGLLAAPGGAVETRLAREWGGISLGATEAGLRGFFKARDISRRAEEPLLKGERLLSLTPLPRGARRFLARFRSGRLWSLTVEYPRTASPRPWGEILLDPSERYGMPHHSQETLAAVTEKRAEWSDGGTRLIYTRRLTPQGTLDSVLLEDIEALSSRNAAALQGASPLSPSDECRSFQECLQRGIRRYTSLDCAGALSDWGHAARLDPGAPQPRYFLSVAWKVLGQQELARSEFGKAVLMDPSVRERGDGLGGPQVQPGRTCKTRPDLP